MTPTSTLDDMPNGANSAAVLCGEFSGQYSFFMEIPDFTYLGFCEPCISRFYATENSWFNTKNAHSMNEIFGASHCFEIATAVVRFYSIFVVHFHSWRNLPLECFDDETVDLFRRLLAMIRQVHVSIAGSSYGWLEKSWRFLNQAADVPAIADFVESFISQYRFPRFYHIRSIAYFGTL